MPHVSPKQVNRKVLEKIYSTLFSAVSNRNISRKQQERAFAELLTPTEKIMLGKRLAAISLLSREESCYRVGKVLQLSETTTGKIQLKIDSGKYNNTIQLCKELQKGPFQKYLENLFKPLPIYGTGVSKSFTDRI